MANYRKIVKLRPEIREFLRYRRSFRGDVLSYQPNIRSDAFWTDAAGFRYSTFRGNKVSLEDCQKHRRYGLVLGASNIFGFGVAGDENTIASLLGQKFGFPFANLAMPGGTSRNLYTLLFNLVLSSARPPALVIHFSGGDLSSFCYSSIADPVFGSPNRNQVHWLDKNHPVPQAEDQLPGFLNYSSFWTTAIHGLCSRRNIPLVLGHDSSFFEKSSGTPTERECELGKPFTTGQRRHFDNHLKVGPHFMRQRPSLARKLKVPLADWGLDDSISFVDEFHFDREGARVVSDALARSIARLP